jgi:hypothetical protein
MLCRRCGIVGDPIRHRWWSRLLPRARRYYCAGCGRTFLRFAFGRRAHKEQGATPVKT